MERYRSSATDIFARMQRQINALERELETLRAGNLGVKWVAPTLGGSASNYGSGYAPAAYMRTSNGLVIIRGVITLPANATIFTLPVGFRPGTGTLVFVTICGTGEGRVDIDTDGDVIVMSGGTGSWFSLGGIVFPAEQ